MAPERGVWLLLLVCITINSSIGAPCGANEVATFERVTGFLPKITDMTLLLSRGPDQTPLTGDCLQSCLNAGDDCTALAMDYSRGACFRVNVTNDEPYWFKPSDNFAVFFQKICLKVPQCGALTWLIERSPGYVLRASDATSVSNVTSRYACAELCITERRFVCRSSQFNSQTNSCHLSREDRRTLPAAFVPSTSPIDYLENQCATGDKAMCSYEEFTGYSLKWTDVALRNLTFTECQKRCDAELTFRCRAFSYMADAERPCLLHSGDLSSAGPGALLSFPGALYNERVPCLNLALRCSRLGMTVKLLTNEPFNGRLYVRGYSDVCDTPGSGRNETTLTVSKRCANFTQDSVQFALVVQYNAILQRRGDRAFNVACRYKDSLLQYVNGSIQIDGDAFLGGVAEVNSSSGAAAAVQVHIVDRTGREATVTEVGQELELRIEAINTEPFDISVGQLIATNAEGTESVLLLDERGCPPDPATFPALSKVPSSKDIVARFRAFRFTSSTVVRFQAKVHFCLSTCPPVSCGHSVVSYGRRRREEPNAQRIVTGPVPSRGIITNSSTSLRPPLEDLPVEMAIIVNGPEVAKAVSIHSNDSLDYDDVAEYREAWCVTQPTFLGVLGGWILLQILLAAVVWGLATSFARSSDNSRPVRLRRVKWHDQAFT